MQIFLTKLVPSIPLWLMELRHSCCIHHKGFPITLFLSWRHRISHIHTNFFNTVLPSIAGASWKSLSCTLLSKFLSTPPSILVTSPTHLNLLGLITLLNVNSTNYEVSCLKAFSTPIPLGSIYFPKDLVLKYLPMFLPNIKD